MVRTCQNPTEAPTGSLYLDFRRTLSPKLVVKTQTTFENLEPIGTPNYLEVRPVRQSQPPNTNLNLSPTCLTCGGCAHAWHRDEGRGYAVSGRQGDGELSGAPFGIWLENT